MATMSMWLCLFLVFAKSAEAKFLNQEEQLRDFIKFQRAENRTDVGIALDTITKPLSISSRALDEKEQRALESAAAHQSRFLARRRRDQYWGQKRLWDQAPSSFRDTFRMLSIVILWLSLLYGTFGSK
eukprot:TRINITY_DN108729_c0_g1_i1.p1 TRINITY_DN108729_c0_g1~~TRINITY_DN108729_c0_g1_i1.p1  ORF type:complete len:128 (-),score=17.09 TRINITY_DN108729_c0_g1_i1:64-447(-)